jgi:hypothetical protein
MERCGSGLQYAGQAGPVWPDFLARRNGARSKQRQTQQQQVRETINPVTGLLHQARKCLAAAMAAYIVRRSWRLDEVRCRGAQNTVNLKDRVCIQSGSNYVEE